MSEKYNRLEHKQVTPTTFKKFDEVGMFDAVKEAVALTGAQEARTKIVVMFIAFLFAFLLFIFSVIFVVRLALSIPL